jgi:hypothetical protein
MKYCRDEYQHELFSTCYRHELVRAQSPDLNDIEEHRLRQQCGAAKSAGAVHAFTSAIILSTPGIGVRDMHEFIHL